MKKSIVLISLFIAAISLSNMLKAQENKSEGIVFFEGSFEDAMALAQKENKILFLDAYASWCGPCKAMQKFSFTSEEVGNFYNQHFINVKIDMEKGEGPALAEALKVEAYPTLYFISPEREVKLRAVGYQNPKSLLKIGSKIL